MPENRKVESDIFLDVPPTLALDAFTEQPHLLGWWGVERSLVEKTPGGQYALAWGISEKGFQYISSGVVKTYRAGEKLEVGHLVYFNPEKEIMGGMSLTVRVEKEGTGTRLYICQSGYRTGGDWDWYFQAVTEAWPMALGHLKKYLESL